MEFMLPQAVQTGESITKNQVIGTYRNYAELPLLSSHPFIWENGKITDLGGIDYVVEDINDVGQVIGWSSNPDGSDAHSFLWQNGEKIDLGGSNTKASALNNLGQIVGNNNGKGFLWQNGQMRSINKFAYGINDAGQVVGVYEVAINNTSEIHAYRWQKEKFTDLGTLGGDYSAGSGINKSGQVIGISKNSSKQLHSFFWQNGIMTDLGTLAGDIVNVWDINDSGQVVGAAGYKRAIIWKNGTATDLNTLIDPSQGWFLSQAIGINNQGNIVGDAIYKGVRHAFLLTPTQP